MWKKNWEEGIVINDPTKRNKNFSHKWRMIDSPHYDYYQLQTVRHIVWECSQTRYEGVFNGLHKYNKEAIE